MKAISTLAWIILLSCLPQLTQAEEPLPERIMLGTWKGSADIIVDWCQQEKLDLLLTVQPNGVVTGKIGDAILKGGKIKRNRGWLGRRLKIKTDYIITGSLEGPIVASENVVRSKVKIPLHFSGTEFTGGLGTDGSKLGGARSGKLSAASLRLRLVGP